MIKIFGVDIYPENFFKILKGGFTGEDKQQRAIMENAVQIGAFGAGLVATAGLGGPAAAAAAEFFDDDEEGFFDDDEEEEVF